MGSSCRQATSIPLTRSKGVADMDELSTITLLFFAAAMLGVGAVYSLIFRATHAHQAMNRRLAFREIAGAALETLRLQRGLVDIANPVLRQANNLLMQTGLKINRTLLALSVLT